MSEYNNIKTTCTKKNHVVMPWPAEKVADLANCSVSTVKKVKIGQRNADTETGRRIQMVIEKLTKKTEQVFADIRKEMKQYQSSQESL